MRWPFTFDIKSMTCKGVELSLVCGSMAELAKIILFPHPQTVLSLSRATEYMKLACCNGCNRGCQTAYLHRDGAVCCRSIAELAATVIPPHVQTVSLIIKQGNGVVVTGCIWRLHLTGRLPARGRRCLLSFHCRVGRWDRSPTPRLCRRSSGRPCGLRLYRRLSCRTRR